MMRILWVDDHQILCVALADYIKQHNKELGIEEISTHAVFSMADALKEIQKESPPDLVFIDINLDSENRGIKTLENFREGNLNGVPFVICTSLTLSTEEEVEILRIGLRDFHARGIILKGGMHEEMFKGLARLLNGEPWFPMNVVKRFAEPTQRSKKESAYEALTKREREVLDGITRGLMAKEIARELRVTDGHIRQVSSVVFQKLNVRNKTEAAMFNKVKAGQIPDVQKRAF